MNTGCVEVMGQSHSDDQPDGHTDLSAQLHRLININANILGLCPLLQPSGSYLHGKIESRAD